MKAYFVTGIGTDIGKTYVGGRLLATWRAAGLQTGAVKPLMSGFAEDALTISDAGVLLAAMGREVTPASVSEICLHRFEAPLAPNVAMRRAGMDQDYGAIRGFAEAALANTGAERFLVEGAGGIMSPVTDTKLHVDFMVDLNLPVILVAASYLGAVSHTLSALSVLEGLGLEVAAVLVSQPTPEAQDPAHLIGEIQRWRGEPCFAVTHGGDVEEAARALG